MSACVGLLNGDKALCVCECHRSRKNISSYSDKEMFLNQCFNTPSTLLNAFAVIFGHLDYSVG